MSEDDLKEPVLRREVENEVENLQESWRVVHGFLQRLDSQNAPDPLLDELEELCGEYQKLHFRLSHLIRFFPEGEK